MFFLTQFLTQYCADRPGRSTGRSTDVHRAVHVCWHSGPVDRSVDRTRELCSLYLGGRPGGRPDQWALLSVSGRSTGRSTGFPNGHIFDHWQSTGRSTASLSGCQISLTASFLFGLYKPHFFEILAKFLWAKISLYSWCLKEVFKRI